MEDMQERGERRQVVLYPEDWRRLELLAEENTGRNKSLLVRRLIEAAFQQPKKFDLHAPKER